MRRSVVSESNREYFRQLSRFFSLLYARMDLNREILQADLGGGSRRRRRGRISGDEDPHAQLREVNKLIRKVRKEIDAAARESSDAGAPIELERVARERKLSETEWRIIGLLCFEDAPLMSGDKVLTCGHELLECVLDDPADVIFHRDVFYSGSKIHDLLQPESYRRRNSPLDARYRLDEEFLRRVLGHSLEDMETENEEPGHPDNGLRRVKASLIEVREPKVRLSDVVLPEAAMSEIKAWIKCARRYPDVESKLGVKSDLLQNRNNTLLLYGPPGTGKTLTAEAVAKSFRKPLLVARYDQIANMWYGNTEKNIVQIFREADKRNGVLLFDECDGLFSRRVAVSSSNDNLLNRQRNILLQLMEAYPGVVILTSNFAVAIDEAFERRIGLRIELPIPDAKQREKIWRSFFSKKTPLARDVNFRKLARDHKFSGGYIRNAVIRSIRHCATNKLDHITHAILEQSAQQEQSSRWQERERRKAVGFASG